MNPPANDPGPLRKRVAFAIMCFRFGINPQQPPKPQAPVPVDLSTDLARSIERQKLTSAALIFLQDRPLLPFTWKPTSHLDLFKNLTFAKYHAVCWLQLQPRMTALAEVEAAVKEAELMAAQPFDADALVLESVDVDGTLAFLLEAVASTKGEEFAKEITVPMPLEG